MLTRFAVAAACIANFAFVEFVVATLASAAVDPIDSFGADESFVVDGFAGDLLFAVLIADCPCLSLLLFFSHSCFCLRRR